MVQADICKYIILSDTDRKKGDLQYPHPNVVHRRKCACLRAICSHAKIIFCLNGNGDIV